MRNFRKQTMKSIGGHPRVSALIQQSFHKQKKEDVLFVHVKNVPICQRF